MFNKTKRELQPPITFETQDPEVIAARARGKEIEARKGEIRARRNDIIAARAIIGTPGMGEDWAMCNEELDALRKEERKLDREFGQLEPILMRALTLGAADMCTAPNSWFQR
jgi:hypothetical protein